MEGEGDTNNYLVSNPQSRRDIPQYRGELQGNNVPTLIFRAAMRFLSRMMGSGGR